MKIDMKQLTLFCQKNKNLLILVGILFLLFIIFLYLFFANNNENLSEGFEKQIENNTSVEENPYKMENVFVPNSMPENNASITPPPPPPLNTANPNPLLNNEANESKAVVEQSPAPLNPQIEENPKQEKPEDMVSFLKAIQKDIELKKDSFIYDGRAYEGGDSFLDFYEIEEIGSNFIRFKDDTYSYNLRFTGENDAN